MPVTAANPVEDSRSLEQLREHYEIERELADRLRQSTAEQRKTLYAEVYDELFRRVPHHPQLRKKANPEEQRRLLDSMQQLLSHFVRADSVYLEVGPGDCALTFRVAPMVARAFGVDVSAEITKDDTPPDNFELLLSDGTAIPVSDNSVQVAFSNQLMEHLHPDDADKQLKNLYKALGPGGHYVCITPNRLNGPHDVSRYFGTEARGFHLREYTASDLRRIFRQAGFRRVSAMIPLKGRYMSMPFFLIALSEGLLELLPVGLRGWLARRLPFRLMLNAAVIGTK